MEGAGFTKGADGLWANPDGSPLQLELAVAQGDPIGPVLSQQLKTAGFDALFQAQQLTAKNDAFVAGNFQMDVGPHCGALYDPWQTLEHFHSKYAAPAGESVKNVRAPTRYANPELDAILDRMEAMQPSPDDPEYMDLVEQASSIFLRDLPEISLAEELHTLIFNSTYWTGWPDAEDPYVAPYLPWEGFALVVHNLKPTE
jgi:peptide/nickel transport system substrate-binding protein